MSLYPCIVIILFWINFLMNSKQKFVSEVHLWYISDKIAF